MFKDHFVLISKNSGIVDASDIVSLNMGVLNNNKNQIASYYGINETTLKSYDAISKIIEDLGMVI